MILLFVVFNFLAFVFSFIAAIYNLPKIRKISSIIIAFNIGSIIAFFPFICLYYFQKIPYSYNSLYVLFFSIPFGIAFAIFSYRLFNEDDDEMGGYLD